MRATELIPTRAARLASPLGIEHAIVGGPMAGIEDTSTRLTRAFSSRWARGVVNRLMQEIDAAGDIAEYPIRNRLTQEIRAAANAQGRADCVSLWAGRAAGLAGTEPAGEVVGRLQRGPEALL